MAYWWASQGKNYETAIKQGTLWSCPTSDGRERADRKILTELRLGDIVFHHHQSNLKAVSEVTESWVTAPRPEGYPRVREADLDEGWLVRVAPIITDLAVHFSRVSELITVGQSGPLGSDGRPAQKYISRLSLSDGERLMAEIGLEPNIGDEDPTVFAAARWGGDVTDVEAFAKARKEQGQLRRHLLRGRSEAECALCGRLLPRRFLVAAHIVPRSKLNDEQRRSFDEVAMLACTLGCDSLFEHGLIVVSQDGTLQAGAKSGNTAVEEARELLVNRICLAHDERTSEAFAAHQQASLDR